MNASTPSFGMAFKLNDNCTQIIRNNLSNAAQMNEFKDSFAMPLHRASEEMAHQISLTKTPLLKRVVGKLFGRKQDPLQLQLESKIMGDSFRTIGISPRGLKDPNYLTTKFDRVLMSMQNQNEKDKAYLAIRGLDPNFQNQMKDTFR